MWDSQNAFGEKSGGQKQMWCIPFKNKKINAPLLLWQKG
jgi:hypothetical protein